MVFRCSCVGGLIECPRVRWDLADWTLIDQPLADVLGVGTHNVREMRAKLKLPRGTVGRKKHKQHACRIDASLIDPRKSVKANAEALNCSPQLIRLRMKQLNQKTP